MSRGVKNGVPGLSIINENEIAKIEYKINAKWALYSESTGIITPYLLTIALAENALSNGVDVKLCSEVSGISLLEDVSLLPKKQDLVVNEEFNGSWNKYLRFDELNYEKKKLLIKSNKLYSEIFCRCEGVTKAEILEAINNPLNSLTLDAVKKRDTCYDGKMSGGILYVKNC